MHVYLAACLRHPGEDMSARNALADACRIYPKLSVAWVQTVLVYKNAADSKMLVEGLMRAGLSD